MVAHRFAEQLRQTQPAFACVAGATTTAFVPCPMFAFFSPAHQAFVSEVYRLAAEQTREQLRPKRDFAPAFSRN
jgi:hypothetical protein